MGAPLVLQSCVIVMCELWQECILAVLVSNCFLPWSKGLLGAALRRPLLLYLFCADTQ